MNEDVVKTERMDWKKSKSELSGLVDNSSKLNLKNPLKNESDKEKKMASEIIVKDEINDELDVPSTKEDTNNETDFDLKISTDNTFSLTNIHENLESKDNSALEKEAKYYAKVGGVAFIQMARRLVIFNSNNGYKDQKNADGKQKYKTFDAWIDAELPIQRSSVYNYIDLVTYFPLTTFTEDEIQHSKLIPFLTLIKKKELTTEQRNEIIEYAVETAKNNSVRKCIELAAVKTNEYFPSDDIVQELNFELSQNELCVNEKLLFTFDTNVFSSKIQEKIFELIMNNSSLRKLIAEEL